MNTHIIIEFILLDFDTFLEFEDSLKEIIFLIILDQNNKKKSHFFLLFFRNNVPSYLNKTFFLELNNSIFSKKILYKRRSNIFKTAK